MRRKAATHGGRQGGESDFTDRISMRDPRAAHEPRPPADAARRSGSGKGSMGETTVASMTDSGFTRGALAHLTEASGGGAFAALRERAFEQFEAMPMPSPETEEWRYTDVRDLELSRYRPYAPEPAA